MKYKNFNVETENKICKITFNQPKKLNALNTEFINELKTFLTQAEKDKDIRVIIFIGEGKGFIAGADIKEMADLNENVAVKFSFNGQSLMNKIEDLKKVTIAAVNGFALGGGLEFALACDIRLLSTSAKLGFPEVNLGLIPGFGGTYRLPRVVGFGIANDLILSGRIIDADYALRIKLASEVYDQKDFENNVLKTAENIIKKGPNAQLMAKCTILSDDKRDEKLKNERNNFSKLFGSDGKEGMKAFIEKREPKWN